MMSNTLVTTFGRMNPPTKSHMKLLAYVTDLSIIKGADAVVYLSMSVDSNKNPLTFPVRKEVIQLAYKENNFYMRPEIKTAIDVLGVLKENDGKYKKIYFVCGQDRYNEYKTLFNKYNGKDYYYDEIHVIPLNRKDGVSSTLARQYVKNDERKKFEEIIAINLHNDVNWVYNKLSWILRPHGINVDNHQAYLDNINKSY